MNVNTAGAICAFCFFAFLGVMSWTDAQVKISANELRAAEIAASGCAK